MRKEQPEPASVCGSGCSFVIEKICIKEIFLCPGQKEDLCHLCPAFLYHFFFRLFVESASIFPIYMAIRPIMIAMDAKAIIQG